MIYQHRFHVGTSALVLMPLIVLISTSVIVAHGEEATLTKIPTNNISDNQQQGEELQVIISRSREMQSSSLSSANDDVTISEECQYETKVLQSNDLLSQEYQRLMDVTRTTPFQNFCIQTVDELACTIPYRQFVSTNANNNNNNNNNMSFKDMCVAAAVEEGNSMIYIESNIELSCNENYSTTTLKSYNIPSCISSKCNVEDIEAYVNNELNHIKDTLFDTQALQCTGSYEILMDGKNSSRRSSSTTATLQLTAMLSTFIISLLLTTL